VFSPRSESRRASLPLIEDPTSPLSPLRLTFTIFHDAEHDWTHSPPTAAKRAPSPPALSSRLLL
jgi:hypothetical protein